MLKLFFAKEVWFESFIVDTYLFLTIFSLIHRQSTKTHRCWQKSFSVYQGNYFLFWALFSITVSAVEENWRRVRYLYSLAWKLYLSISMACFLLFYLRPIRSVMSYKFSFVSFHSIKNGTKMKNVKKFYGNKMQLIYC